MQRGNSSGTQGNFVNILVDLYMTSMLPDDLERIPILPGDISPQRHGKDTPPGTDWINYIKGNDPDYPMRALQAALAELRANAVPSSGGDAAGAAAAFRCRELRRLAGRQRPGVSVQHFHSVAGTASSHETGTRRVCAQEREAL